AADHALRAFLVADRDVVEHRAELALVDARSHGNAGGEAVAHAHDSREIGDATNEFIGHTLHDDGAARGRAALAPPAARAPPPPPWPTRAASSRPRPATR